MLETITQGFRNARNALRGQVELTETNVEGALSQVRVALLEADVDLGVVRKFVAQVKDKALGEIVKLNAADGRGKKIVTTPSDHFIKICHDELEALMGPVDTELKYSQKRPTGIMMVGLQGSGKTTTTAKLASWLKRKGKKPMLVAADIYRPAAVEQLQILGKQLDVPVFSAPGLAPPELCEAAVNQAFAYKADTLLFDTAGRLAIDDEMMRELERVKAVVNPDNILLVVDAMIGQDAVTLAREFNEKVGVTGLVLTRIDGDARGGAALSMRAVTGRAIKFLGAGEKLEALEPFHPDRIASRILGMGDVVSLVEKAMDSFEADEAEKMAAKMAKGKFDLDDMAAQFRQIKRMGDIKGILGMLPGIGAIKKQIEGANIDQKQVNRQEAIILSMTKQERKNPDLLKASRKRRIAAGAGVDVQDVNKLLKQYQQMADMMKKMSKLGKKGLMRHGIGGLLPPR